MSPKASSVVSTRRAAYRPPGDVKVGREEYVVLRAAAWSVRLGASPSPSSRRPTRRELAGGLGLGLVRCVSWSSGSPAFPPQGVRRLTPGVSCAPDTRGAASVPQPL